MPRAGRAFGDRAASCSFASDEAATLEVGGEVTSRPGKRRLFGLRTKRRQLPAGVEETVSWKLSKRRVRRCRRLIRKHSRVGAKFDVTAVDSAGNDAPTQSKRVRLVRR